MTDLHRPQERLNINANDDWLTIRARWARERMASLHARAERYFITGEDMPMSAHLMLMTITAFVFTFIVWASFATLDEVTRGEGKIIPSSQIQMVQSQEGGIVQEFLVAKGDTVEANQILARLSPIEAAADLGSNQARYYGLLATVTRLQAEAEGHDTLSFPEGVTKAAPQSVIEETNTFAANRRKVREQISVLEQQRSQRSNELSELRTRARDLAAVIQLSVEEKRMIEPLVAKGSAPKIELVQLERGIKERQTELNGVRESMPRAESAIREAEARISELQSSARAEAQLELSTKLIEMNTVKETLGALEDRKDRTEIRSPMRGIVKDITLSTVGGVLKPGDRLFEIVPLDDQLLVEANIRPADIAFLHPGQAAIVKITAYDFSIYGSLKGEVVDISADAFTNEKGESFYRVRVRTHDNSLKRKGEILPIIPGMVTQVDILTGKKTVMDYILKPIVKTVSNAMNER